MHLRDVTSDDLPMYLALLCDPDTMEHLGGPITREKAEDTLRRQLDPRLRERTWSRVVVTDDGHDAGSLVLWTHEDGEPLDEIGWMVLPDHRGKGVGTWGVRALLDEAAADGRWGPIHAYPAVSNAASNAIAHTLGFTFVEERGFTYQGRALRCNVWRIDPPYGAPAPGA
jgi:RimJ/RimL family protein N-acetyltransferase